MSTTPTLLDSIVQRLQNMAPFSIWQIAADGSISPWFEVSGAICADIVIHAANQTDQGAAVSAQITHWGRLAAQAQRVWEIEERHYRIWRDTRCLESSRPDPADKDWKKPTEKQIEQLYRTHPDYSIQCMKVERAAEALASANAVLEGFKAKAAMLKANPGRNVF